MRFPQEHRPTPYLNRRDQYRMLAMVGLLCLVMVAIKLAAQPSSWHWLLPPDGDMGATPTAAADTPVTLKELDFRVKSSDTEPLPPDVFRSAASVDAVTREEEIEQAGDISDHEGTLDVHIPEEFLAPIEDNTFGVRRAELDAYHDMLDRVRRLPETVVEQAADDGVAFTVIMLQSDDYRGKLIRVTGQLRRVTEYPVMENESGIDHLYEGWLFTNDSANNPWRIVTTSLPEGLPLGEEVEPVKVSATGYFFKRTGYASQSGQHVAPTLLAKSYETVPVTTNIASEVRSEMHNWLLGFIGFVVAALALMIWLTMTDDRKFAGSRLGELAKARLDADPEDLSALANVDTVDPNRLFAADDEPLENLPR